LLRGRARCHAHRHERRKCYPFHHLHLLWFEA
jgi:hypothetical protein